MFPLRNHTIFIEQRIITGWTRYSASCSLMFIAKIITRRKMTKVQRATKVQSDVAWRLSNRWIFSISLTFEITHAIIVTVHKTAGINLIENRVVPPFLVKNLSRGRGDENQEQTKKDNVMPWRNHLYYCAQRSSAWQFICQANNMTQWCSEKDAW